MTSILQPIPILQIMVNPSGVPVDFTIKKFHQKNEKFEQSTKCKFRQLDPVHIIQTYFNCCWALFIVPFRIMHDGTEYQIHWDGLHKVICGMLHLLTIVNAFLEIHGSFEAPIQYEPSIVFLVAERAAAALSPVVFFYKVWFKREHILTLLETLHDGKRLLVSAKSFHRPMLVLFIFRLSFSVLYAMSRYFYVAFVQLRPEPNVMNEAAADAMFKLYQISATKKSMVSYEELLPFQKILVVTSIILKFYYSILLDTIAMLALMSSILAYNVTSEFHEMIKNSGFQNNTDGNKEESNWVSRKLLVMQRYYEMKQKLSSLNRMVESVFLVVFCSLIAFFSGIGISAVMIYGGYFYICQLSVYIFIYIVTLVLAAESNHKANLFKEWLLLQGRGESVQDIFEYLRVSNDQLGINGGRFFVVTYGFLGTALSVLLTYSIIMIDFEKITLFPGQNITEPSLAF